MSLLQIAGSLRQSLRMVPSFLWLLELRMRGFQITLPITLVGQPICSRYPGSSISFGSGVALDSAIRSNRLGGFSPCVVRTVTPTARIQLGDRVGLSNSVIVAGNTIEIGQDTILGSGVMILDNDFHVMGTGFSWVSECSTNSKPIKIGRGCFIGSRSMILKGVTLGDRAVIGAGAVVTKDIPAYSMAAGNPARIVRTIPKPNLQ